MLVELSLAIASQLSSCYFELEIQTKRNQIKVTRKTYVFLLKHGSLPPISLCHLLVFVERDVARQIEVIFEPGRSFQLQ